MPTSKTTRGSRTTSSSSSKRTAKKANSLTLVDPGGSPLDDAAGYEITQQVNLAQLAAEIGQAAGVEHVNLALSSNDKGDTLWITPAGIESAKIAQVLADHNPDPNWGIPQAILDFNDALGRLRDNPDGPLSDTDQVALIKGIALNFTALMPKPSG